MLAARIQSEVDRLSVDGEFAGFAAAVAEHRLDPYDAADRLLEAVYGAASGTSGTSGTTD